MSAIGVDIDDVLYGWFDAAHRVSEAAGITNGVMPTSWAPYEDYGCTTEQWHETLAAAAVTGEMYLEPPLPGALEGLELLRDAGHTIHLCTARGLLANGHLIRSHTITWLEQFGVPMDSLTFSKDKALIRVNWFVDDNKQNILDVSANGTVGVLVTKPWNADLNWPWRVDSLLAFAQQLTSAGMLAGGPL